MKYIVPLILMLILVGCNNTRKGIKPCSSQYDYSLYYFNKLQGCAKHTSDIEVDLYQNNKYIRTDNIYHIVEQYEVVKIKKDKQ